MTSWNPRLCKLAMMAGNAAAVLGSPTCIKMMAPSSCSVLLLVMRSIRNPALFGGSTESRLSIVQ